MKLQVRVSLSLHTFGVDWRHDKNKEVHRQTGDIAYLSTDDVAGLQNAVFRGSYRVAQVFVGRLELGLVSAVC